ncbi:MAG: L,D-transpeptidase family protein [bacterium]|jgi:L,D-transpeptidase ErfK/SrfK
MGGKNKLIALFVLIFLLSCSGSGIGEIAAQVEKEGVNSEGKHLILNIPSFTLKYFVGGQLLKQYPIAVGKSNSPTPVGEFRILNKLINPTWHPPDGGEPVPPGPSNPLGSRWMGFAPGYGIHGNNAPASIGASVSLGCVRMYNEDVEELFAQVPIGTPVTIKYETLESHWNPEQGQIGFTLHPDVYNLGVNTVENLHKWLAVYDLDAIWPETVLANLLSDSQKGPVTFPAIRQVQVTLNGEKIKPRLSQDGKELLLPLRAIAEQLGFCVEWDEVNRVPVLEGEVITGGSIFGGRTYLAVGDFLHRLGLKTHWHEEEQHLELYRIVLFFADSMLTDDIYWEGEDFYLAVDCLSALGITYQWKQEQGVVEVLGKEVAGFVRDDGIYLCLQDLLAKLEQQYNTTMEWDAENYYLYLRLVEDNPAEEDFHSRSTAD